VVGFFFAGYIARFDRVLLAMEALAMGLLATRRRGQRTARGHGDATGHRGRNDRGDGRSLLRDILGGDAPQLLRPGVFLGVIALGGSIPVRRSRVAWTHSRCCHR
jgi:hypothetical protein